MSNVVSLCVILSFVGRHLGNNVKVIEGILFSLTGVSLAYNGCVLPAVFSIFSLLLIIC